MGIKEYYKAKKERKEIKQTSKRNATGEEVILIFTRVLEGKRCTQILNELKRINQQSPITNKHVKKIMTGNCKVHANELDVERYGVYLDLREKVYAYHEEKKKEKTEM